MINFWFWIRFVFFYVYTLLRDILTIPAPAIKITGVRVYLPDYSAQYVGISSNIYKVVTDQYPDWESAVIEFEYFGRKKELGIMRPLSDCFATLDLDERILAEIVGRHQEHTHAYYPALVADQMEMLYRTHINAEGGVTRGVRMEWIDPESLDIIDLISGRRVKRVPGMIFQE